MNGGVFMLAVRHKWTLSIALSTLVLTMSMNACQPDGSGDVAGGIVELPPESLQNEILQPIPPDAEEPPLAPISMQDDPAVPSMEAEIDFFPNDDLRSKALLDPVKFMNNPNIFEPGFPAGVTIAIMEVPIPNSTDRYVLKARHAAVHAGMDFILTRMTNNDDQIFSHEFLNGPTFGDRQKMTIAKVFPDGSVVLAGEFTGNKDFAPGDATDMRASFYENMHFPNIFYSYVLGNGTYSHSVVNDKFSESMLRSVMLESVDVSPVSDAFCLRVFKSYQSTAYPAKREAWCLRKDDIRPLQFHGLRKQVFGVSRLAKNRRLYSVNKDASGLYLDCRTFHNYGCPTDIEPGDGRGPDWRFRLTGYTPNYIEATAEGDVFITGGFQNSVDLDPGPNTSSHDSYGDSDVFIVKISNQAIFQWSRSIGSERPEGLLTAVAVDSMGRAHWAASVGEAKVSLEDGTVLIDKPVSGNDTLLVLQLSPEGAMNWFLDFGNTNRYLHSIDIVEDDKVRVVAHSRGYNTNFYYWLWSFIF